MTDRYAELEEIIKLLTEKCRRLQAVNEQLRKKKKKKNYDQDFVPYPDEERT